MSLHELFAACGGVVTRQQILSVATPKRVEVMLGKGELIRVRRGIYALHTPDVAVRLAALDICAGERVVACMNTAAELFGFNTEPDDRIHVLDPGIRLRPTPDVMVHQRIGAPLKLVGGRLCTAPAWTAVEIARSVRRPRALAVLDAALRSGTCDTGALTAAIDEQRGRRGIVQVRELVTLADGRAESPMESEARLAFHDGGLPAPQLQYEIVDLHGRLWHVDFAWPEFRLVAEYESMEWHANPISLRHDRMKVARLQECGWLTTPLVVDDVRRHPDELVARLRLHMAQRAS
ncbi:type IV toxin-antitoxin system AbiEi family antitoxin domain-containing protein [Mycolicibacterium neoaurum]|uniref:type IV toxin-antitoxin system AbiEi family antitoxin domain-containing protein n=1 Tax=Mycolicibacterium neoaurum TaxID=1795 RepID=UPI001F4C7CEE|nr:type IV toxin-antitoxin system AbiEi family antitoxin domain-containing protein [Mycolicibacterium neoaurum]